MLCIIKSTHGQDEVGPLDSKARKRNLTGYQKAEENGGGTAWVSLGVAQELKWEEGKIPEMLRII